MDILSNLPAVIALVLVVGFLVFTGTRLGLAFLVRRLAGLVFVLASASFIAFILGFFAPKIAIIGQLGQHATKESIAEIEHYYGVDLPWYEQYWRYIQNLLHFNLGESYSRRGELVWPELARQLPFSINLGLTAALLAVVVGVSLGLFAAVRSNTRYDTSIQTFALVFFALPTFVLIPLYQFVVVILQQRGITTLPLSSTEFGWDHIDQMIAPVTLFSVVQMAFFVRLTRTSMLEVLRQDYVRTARAKGLGERKVIWGHAFRNAMIPLVTALGPALAFIVNGAFITERIFNIPGIGTTTLQAIAANDFPLLQGTVMLLAVAVSLMNLATDVVYGVIDPRIKSV